MGEYFLIPNKIWFKSFEHAKLKYTECNEFSILLCKITEKIDVIVLSESDVVHDLQVIHVNNIK